MQSLTSFDSVPTVGGYALRAAGTPAEGFRFIADATYVGPWVLELVQIWTCNDGLKLSAAIPSGGDPTGYQILVLPGEGETPGALGLLMPEARLGLLFKHPHPAESIQITTSTPEEFVAVALEQYSQKLEMPLTRSFFGAL